jgi:quinol-cytochrome oxidoreductase complex cytochrome b subunit
MKAETFRRWMGISMISLLGFATFTGVMLQAYHVPTLEKAPHAYLMLRTRVFLGDAMMAMHFWSAHLLMALAMLHLVETVWHRRFRASRVQWLVGWVLLGLLVLADLTGHLLPVHREGYWTYTRSMEALRMIPGVRSILGLLLGWQEGVSNLTYVRSYAFHVTVFLLLFGPLAVWHGMRWMNERWTLSYRRFALRFLEITVGTVAFLATLGYILPVVSHRLEDPLHPPAHTAAVWALRPVYGLSRWMPEGVAALLFILTLVYGMLLPFLPERAAGRSRRALLLVVLTLLLVSAWLGGQG